MKASIAIQILPLTSDDRVEIIDKVIAYLQKRHHNLLVTPFETVIEGELDDLMTSIKDCIKLSGDDCNNVFANVKINYGDILSTDEKISKYSKS